MPFAKRRSDPPKNTHRPRAITRDKVTTNDAPSIIAGRVIDDQGKGVPNAQVRVIRDLLNAPQLAAARTDREGRYEIRMKKQDCKAATGGSTKLEVRSAKGKAVKVVSLDLKNGQETRTDVVIPSELPLLETLKQRIARTALATASAIKDGDEEKLAKVAGVDQRLLVRYTKAAALARELALPEEWTFAVLSSRGVKDQRTLFASAPERLNRLVKRAGAKGEIKAMTAGQLERAVAQVQTHAVR